jgi:hypothetical protein
MAGSIDPGISGLIRDHARAMPSLPVTCRNSNIASLDLGAEAGISMPAVRHARASWVSSVRAIQTIIIVTLAAAIGACSATETCEEPMFYESAQAGRRIEAPADLDEIAAYKEIPIPEASPRPPRPPGSGCIDRPPTLRLEDTDEDEEGEAG